MNTLTILGLVLIFLGGVGGIIVSLGQAQSSQVDKLEIISTTKNENTILKNQIGELRSEREILNATLVERDKKIQIQNDNIQALSNKLIEKSEYIEKFISGNDRYPIVEMRRIRSEDKTEEAWVFEIHNVFELPINNIEIEAFDYEKLSAAISKIGEKKAINFKAYQNTMVFEFDANEIPAGTFRTIPEEHTDRSGSYFFKIHSRSTLTIQKVVIIQKENISYIGYVIVDSGTGKVLKEIFYDNTPLEVRTELKSKLAKIPNDLDLIFTR